MGGLAVRPTPYIYTNGPHTAPGTGPAEKPEARFFFLGLLLRLELELELELLLERLRRLRSRQHTQYVAT